MSKTKSRAAGAIADRPSSATAGNVGSNDVVADALAVRSARKQTERGEDDQWRRDMRAIYALIIARIDRPEPCDAAELANVMDALALSEADLRRDLAALKKFREQAALRDGQEEARQAFDRAYAAREKTRARHKQEWYETETAVDRTRHAMGDAQRAGQVMAGLQHDFPHLAGVFDDLAAA